MASSEGNKVPLILLHDSDDDEEERKKNLQDAIQMWKNKNKEQKVVQDVRKKNVKGTIQMLKNEDKEENVVTDFAGKLNKMKQEGTVDPDYALFMEHMMSNEPPAKRIAKFNQLAATDAEENNMIDEEEYSVQGTEEQHEEQGELLFRGPVEVYNNGKKNFDKYFKFGNDMELNKEQQSFLDEFCATNGKGLMKYYVHKMIHSCVVKGKCKMTFGANFSTRYLKTYLDSEKMVTVQSNASGDKFSIKMMIGAGSNNVVMTTSWAKAIKAYNINKNDMVVSKFGLDEKGALDLTMVPIPSFD